MLSVIIVVQLENPTPGERDRESPLIERATAVFRSSLRRRYLPRQKQEEIETMSRKNGDSRKRRVLSTT